MRIRARCKSSHNLMSDARENIIEKKNRNNRDTNIKKNKRIVENIEYSRKRLSKSKENLNVSK